MIAPKLRRDWIGCTVRAKRDIRNGYMMLPAGTLFIVDSAHRKANLRSKRCDCCGMWMFVTQVEWDALEFLGRDT